MTSYEALEIVNLLPYSNRDSWEQTRYLMWLTAQVNSSKKIQPQEIMKFEWEGKKNKPKELSNKEVENIKEKMKLFNNILNNGKL